MLAQLKTVVLIKEAIHLSFFRLVEYLEHKHFCVRLQAQNGQKQMSFFLYSSVYSCSEKLRLFHARNGQETEDLVQRCVLLPWQNSATGSNQNRKRNGRHWCTTDQEDKYIRVSSLRNRRLTSPQLAASWNSTRKNTSLYVNSSICHQDGIAVRRLLSSSCRVPYIYICLQLSSHTFLYTFFIFHKLINTLSCNPPQQFIF